MQAQISTLQGQLRETRKGLEEAERRRVADSRELRGRVEKGEKEMINVKKELLDAKWGMEMDLVATRAELEGEWGTDMGKLEGKLETVKEELEGKSVDVKGEVIAVKGELIAVKGELETVKRQLIGQKNSLGKEAMGVKEEVKGLRMGASERSAAVEQGQTSRHEEIDVEEQLESSQGDAKSLWQKIRATATLDLKGQTHLSDALLAHQLTALELLDVSSSVVTRKGAKMLKGLV
ncbi:unnamed protein product [Closterium sp. Naga37s-1]|nr:unnamed protein product [Closterium sp. Naga37s-1]